MKIEGLGPGVDHKQAAEQIEIQIKYAGYIDWRMPTVEEAEELFNGVFLRPGEEMSMEISLLILRTQL